MVLVVRDSSVLVVVIVVVVVTMVGYWYSSDEGTILLAYVLLYLFSSLTIRTFTGNSH